MAAEVLELTNQERAKEGLSPLKANPELQANAMQRASEIAVYFDHMRPNNTKWPSAVTVSYGVAAENIAYGYSSAEAVVNGWMNSDGHRKNILTAEFTTMGVGCFSQNGYTFWVQLFTNNPASGAAGTGQKEVIAHVDAESALVYFYAVKAGTDFCLNSPISVNEGETANVVIYNLNRGANIPIAIRADSFYYRSDNPYSTYFTYGLASGGEYMSVTGIKSNESTKEAMPMMFGMGGTYWSTNVTVRHKHIPGPAATCTTDQICTSCKSVLVKAIGHRQSHYYACEKDITCINCKTVLEKAAGHKIQGPTCTEDGYCTVCKEKFGSKLYHTYPPRDCLKELHCSRCGYRRYQAYTSHYWEQSASYYKAATIFSPALYKKECLVCDQYQLIKKGEKKTAVLKLNLSSIKLKRNQSFDNLKVTELSSGDSVVSVKSAKNSVVEVAGFTAKGQISLKAKKTGTAKITIQTEAGAKKSVTVKVQKSAVKTTKITNVKKSLTIKRGKTKALNPVLNPIYSSQKLTYKSSNQKIASVNALGVITAKKRGTATITVKSGSVTVKCKVKVK